MAITAAQIVAKVSVEGDEEAKAKLHSMDDAAKETSGGFGSMLKGALSFATGTAIFNIATDALGFLKDQMIDVVKVAINHQQVNAQTVQALKSTRDASGETSKSIQDLAESLSKITPNSEDSIQSVENLELTFTNIGKNIFPQTTSAVLDVATAMHEDLQSAAVEVGKALGAPLTGMTALQRIGVTFSEAQKEAIKQMMATGNIAGAQKIILQELQKEFGGSAEAAGKTFGGQLQIAQNRLEDLKIKIGTALLPILNQFLGWFLKDGMPVLERFANWFSHDGVQRIGNFSNWIQTTLIPTIKLIAQWIQQNVIPVLQGFAAWFIADGVPALQRFAGFITGTVIPAIAAFFAPVVTLVQWVQAHWKQIWETVGPVVVGAFNIVVGAIRVAWNLISGIFNLMRDGLSGNWRAMWNDLVGMFSGIWDGLVQMFKGGIDEVIGMLNGLINGLNAININVGPIHIKPSIPTIPMLASGGVIAQGGDVIVGDKGPERLTLPTGARVTPLGMTSPASTGGAPVVVQLSINGYQFARAVMPDFVTAIRGGTGRGGI